MLQLVLVPAPSAGRRRRLLLLTTVLAVLAGVAVPNARATEGPVASYGFDDGAGSVVRDNSGNMRDGAIAGASWVPGRFGTALEFDGVAGRVDLPALGTFYKTGFTLQAWVKKRGTRGDMGILGTWVQGLGGGPMLWVDHASRRYSLTLSTGSSNYLDSGRSPTLGQWEHLTATYDGATARFYFGGQLVASRAFLLDVGNSDVWRIGAYGATPGNGFDGTIDEVRIYDRPLSDAEVQRDATERVRTDQAPPTAPTGFTRAATTATSITTQWQPSSDNVGVQGYRLYRGGEVIATTTGTTYRFRGLSCQTAYALEVEAFDRAANASARTPLTASTGDCDTTRPTVSVTAPAENDQITGITALTATADDDDAVASVRFQVDGRSVGEDAEAPYRVEWNGYTATPGARTLTAVARDASGNETTSAPVRIIVADPPPDTGLVAAYSFDDGAGTIAGDASGNGRHGSIFNAGWAPGRNGTALDLNGTSSRVDLPALGTFYRAGFTLEAWVKKRTIKKDVAIVGSWEGNRGGPMLWIDNVAGRYYQTLGTGITNYLDSGHMPPIGSWQHIAGTYDGAVARFYVDGVEVASRPFASSVGTQNGWRIGAFGTGSKGFFDGLIDDVRIYDRARSADEIQSDLARPASGSGIRAVSPREGARDVAAGPPVTATFTVAMQASSVTNTSFHLNDASGSPVPASVSYSSVAGTASLTPTVALSYGATYTATVEGGSGGVRTAGGEPLPDDRTWSFTVADQPPVLLVTSSSQPFSRYLGDILRAEGLSAFTQLDLGLVTPAVLAGFDSVVLGEMPVSAAQADMLSGFVNGGGNLVAMRPDNRLSGLLGLAPGGPALSEGYLAVDTSGGPGAGITGETMQFHGTADRYSLDGATAVATLYSSATSATGNPAVTIRSVGSNGGQAVAFTYDLARSVVYTRQGNPAWAGQERDGIIPIRSNDLFFGAASGDPRPDWVDLSKIAIPQADEQQRLLANLLTRMGEAPLPRFWYLPRGLRAAVVMTGDDHARGGTTGRFDRYIELSPAGCSVADWECVRSTSYVYTDGQLTDAQARDYTDRGFEVSLHIATLAPTSLQCSNWTPTSLATIFDERMGSFRRKFTSIPSPVTHRMHCVSWSDWATLPKMEGSYGIRLDTNYYAYPGNWIGTRPGFMTGSGLVMRFADTDGTPIDVYQAATQMTDESGQPEPATIDALLDGALGPAGYYGVFTANIHTDTGASAESEAIVGAALARGVPVISAKQLLSWVDGREASSFRALQWTAGTLSFEVDADSRARGLRAMLPVDSGSRSLESIDGPAGAVPFTLRTVKGIDYAVFEAGSGQYAAQYAD
jgi:chitodextrinase